MVKLTASWRPPFDAARAEANDHTDDGAFVAMLVGNALVGAVTRQR